MTPKDFLEERLKLIFDTIGSINIKYQYNEQYDTHIVEITPLREFKRNEDYISLERELLYDFNDLYFPSTLIFATENSLNRVEIPEFSFIREEKIVIEYLINGLESGVDTSNNFAIAA